jgi:hypothetical protein
MLNIEFHPVNIEYWMEIRNKKNYTFWLINEDDECITGYFDGFDDLDDKDCDHFLTHRNYYYYRSISQDLLLLDDYVKYEDNEDIEIHSIQNEITLKHMLNIRKGLIKRIKDINIKMHRSKSMNGMNFG